jgi:hypothetical protein
MIRTVGVDAPFTARACFGKFEPAFTLTLVHPKAETAEDSASAFHQTTQWTPPFSFLRP